MRCAPGTLSPTSQKIESSSPKCKQGGQLIACGLGTNSMLSQPTGAESMLFFCPESKVAFIRPNDKYANVFVTMARQRPMIGRTSDVDACFLRFPQCVEHNLFPRFSALLQSRVPSETIVTTPPTQPPGNGARVQRPALHHQLCFPSNAVAFGCCGTHRPVPYYMVYWCTKFSILILWMVGLASPRRPANNLEQIAGVQIHITSMVSACNNQTLFQYLCRNNG